jgi:hypothetical protein
VVALGQFVGVAGQLVLAVGQIVVPCTHAVAWAGHCVRTIGQTVVAVGSVVGFGAGGSARTSAAKPHTTPAVRTITHPRSQLPVIVIPSGRPRVEPKAAECRMPGSMSQVGKRTVYSSPCAAADSGLSGKSESQTCHVGLRRRRRPIHADSLSTPHHGVPAESSSSTGRSHAGSDLPRHARPNPSAHCLHGSQTTADWTHEAAG